MGVFLVVGVVVGNEEELLFFFFFFETLEDNRGQEPKIFLSVRKIQSHRLPPYLSQGSKTPWPAFCALLSSQGFLGAL